MSCMPTTFRCYSPEQTLLLPPSPRDWLPEGHLAYFISDTVDNLDLSSFYEPYEGDGRRNRPFDPRMMVKVLLYGYATGTFSSRKLAKKLHEDVAFRVLCGENFPAHRTIAEFRQQHLMAFQGLFVQVVRVAKEVGLVSLGTVAIDGTKVKASASKHKAMSYGRMQEEEQRLQAQIEELTSRASQADAQEDALYGEECSGEDIPEELKPREQRLKKIRAAMDRLKSRQAEADRQKGRSPEKKSRAKRPFGEPEKKSQDNFTDPESRIMKTSSGFDQCYNGQLTVDSENRLIVATGLTQSAADVEQLLPMVEKTAEVVQETPREVLADAGYRSESNLQKLEDKGISGYVSLGREGKSGAVVTGEENPATRRMQEKLATEAGRKTYGRRKGIVEPVNGWIKSVLGFRQFSLRGLAKAAGEWTLVCLALNLRQMSPRMGWQ
jgi:transposase